LRRTRVESTLRPSADGSVAAAERGMVASAFPEASAAGVEMLRLGGNAADAACAVGLALGVCEPQASGVGGQCMGLVHHDGTTVALDGSSRSPSLAHVERLGPDDRRIGYRATTVPSAVATYAWLNSHYGRLPWHSVVEPASRIARDGYRITTLQHRLQKRELKRFELAPTRSGARYFLKNGISPYQCGDVFRQPELALMLETLAEDGPEAFYAGEIAAQIDADMRAHYGFLRAEDLALIPWPIERRPLRRRYRSVSIATMPPPGAGRILLLVMMILEALPSRFLAGSTPERYHFLAEAFRKAFLQRLDRPFDPNSYPQVRSKVMTSRDVARQMAESIHETMDAQLPFEDFADVDDESGDVTLSGDRGETTHFSAMDDEGNAVSMTQSIELVYGSKVAAEDLGFLYNDYLAAFDVDDPGHPYYLRPNAVPWSTAAPSIVFHASKPWIAFGSPGSERIYSSLAQVLINIVDGSTPLDAAIDAPRMHCSAGGRLSLEEQRFPAEARHHLALMGYRMDPREDYSFYLGCVQGVLATRSGGFQGVADPRRDGTAQGL
jgi:gamma-glutamyltranspeptidase/glutathione hydrolase